MKIKNIAMLTVFMSICLIILLSAGCMLVFTTQFKYNEFQEITLNDISKIKMRSDAAPGIGMYPHEIEYGFFDYLFVAAIIIIELLFIGFGLLNVIALIGIFVYGVISIIKKCIK